MLLFFTIPLLDLLIVTSHRISRGISPTTGGTDHISHRLLASNFSEEKVLLCFGIYSLCSFGLILISIMADKSIAFGALIVLLLIFVITFLKIRKMKILT